MPDFTNLDVCQSVAPADYMYNVLPEQKKTEYFSNSTETMVLIDRLATMTGRTFDAHSTILDYGAGYGRMTRHFAAYMGPENVFACDIHPPAINFCRETLAVDGRVVAAPFDEIDLGRTFDWIFAGSVFTHIHASYWSQVLTLFTNSLNKGGCVFLTTAGDNVAQLVHQGAFDDIAKGAARAMYAGYRFLGYGYAQYLRSETIDRDLGRCIVAANWVTDFVARFTGLELIAYLKQAYWGRQDVYLLSPRERPPGG